MGLRNAELRSTIRTYARRNPDATFNTVLEEVLLLESEQRPGAGHEIGAQAVGESSVLKSQTGKDDWAEAFRRELLQEVRGQMNALRREMTQQLQPAASEPPRSSHFPNQPPPRRRFQSYTPNTWAADEGLKTVFQDQGTRKAWTGAFAVCQRAAVVGGEDGYMGFVRPASRKGLTVPARSEVVVWGRARMGPRGQDYCGLIEALPELGLFSVAKTVAIVKHGQLPIRIQNMTSCPVFIGRYQKLAKVFRVDRADVHGQTDLSLTVQDDGTVAVDIVEAGEGEQVEPPVGMLRDLQGRDDLTERQKQDFEVLLQRWVRVFALHEEDFGHTDAVQHQIHTNDAPPVREKYRPLPPMMYQEMRTLLADMLEKKVIQPSSSPWAAPIVMVRKKDGSWRFCVDYRKLNSLTYKDAFPLPRIEETLTSLTQASWFTTLDLASGYWQVGVDPRDRPKTAFTTPLGLYEFQRMPFGLCNAPATFQRLMQQCLSSQIADSRLQHHGLKLRVDKCQLLQREVRFLGHVVTGEGVKPDPTKVTAVTEWPVPTTIKEVRVFLGLAGYYRRFIVNFAKVARPLNALLSGAPADKRTGSRQISWSDECQQAFDQLKTALTRAPILAYANYAEPFVLYTDASHAGLGAVLAQLQDGRERVVAYASRSLHPSEKNDANYSSFKLELLALKWAIVEKFKDYLMGAKVIVYTDNNPVAHLQTARLGATEQRWVAQLAAFDYQVRYRSGKENANADALSRVPVETPVDTDVINVVTVADVQSTEGQSMDGWRARQLQDKDLEQVRRYVESGKFPVGQEWRVASFGVKRLLQQRTRLVMRDGVLCRRITDFNTHEARLQIVCPIQQRQEVWEKYHDAVGHLGVERTISCLRRHFFWPGMQTQVQQYHSMCPRCQMRKTDAVPKAPLKPFTVSFPLEVIELDFLSLGRPQDPYQNILVMTDMFSRYAWAIPTRDQTARTTARVLWQSVIQTFGCPMRFHSDQGPNFESQLVAELCSLYGISKSRTTPYHPQGNGMCERLNQTLLSMLRTLEDEKQSRWPEHLPALVQAYNATLHSSTGYAPSYLMFGRHVRLPVDVALGVENQHARYSWDSWVGEHHQHLLYAYSLAAKSMGQAADQYKKQYDRRAKSLPLAPGERVWRRNRRDAGRALFSTFFYDQT
ncbi:interleukin-1 receptor accessory protein-like 1-A [Pimephales promelas]|nr:interleukin-1 receptor accessory protein-like 1-A [Pimephales promelas]